MSDIPREYLEKILKKLDPDYRETASRKRLYEEGFRYLPHLPELAMEWFQEIANEVSPLGHELWFSKRRPDEEIRYGAPDWLYHEDTLETPPLDEIHRLKIEDNQTLLMWRGRERTPKGYKSMVIRDEFFRVDMAILAVLTVMEADRVEPRKPWEYTGGEPELDFAGALLRYYREDFDGLSPDDQKQLKIEAFSKIYDFLEALRLLMAYLEYGKPREGLTRKPMTSFRRDVRAAELKHIEGLKYHEIAERLAAEGMGFGEPKNARDEKEKKEKDARRAKDSAKRGKERYLEKALGEKGARQHFRKARAEMKHFEQLDEVDRQMWRLADESDHFRISVVKKLAHGDGNKPKRDRVRKWLSSLLQASEGDPPVL